jgi:hypothetical protein
MAGLADNSLDWDFPVTCHETFLSAIVAMDGFKVAGFLCLIPATDDSGVYCYPIGGDCFVLTWYTGMSPLRGSFILIILLLQAPNFADVCLLYGGRPTVALLWTFLGLYPEYC